MTPSHTVIRAMAAQLGHTKLAKLLQETLNEEGAADKKLTAMAMQEVLPAANEYEIAV